MVTLWLSDDCHLTERSWMEEVATHLPTDRPLLDDGLFIDQSEMIYSIDSGGRPTRRPCTFWLR
ncbi:unnamed protein product [Spirodela intermedia]|uniref:Uncharacterized protein n=1 Tax=Spirodela intermedia TaxID=51605 RepID=A0ABN7EDC2_SPIIN|nr:unnamed protein product [Spirodela intermedia]